MSVFGYKAMDPDMSCRGVKFAVGETYAIDGMPELCERGYHFCESAYDVWSYYSRRDAIVCEVEALGVVVTDGKKSCTNRIRIISRMDPIDEGRLRYGRGHGDGHGYGDGYYGYGDGYGYGYGNGYGNGYGDGNGYGYGDGNGYGDGYGYGNGNGYGDGNGYGNGSGYGNGYGDGNISKVLEWEA